MRAVSVQPSAVSRVRTGKHVATMRDFRTLIVWQKAYLLTLAVYHATASFPREEVYGLTSQTRRACASIPANIAEGCGRGGVAEFAQLLRIAAGSASELEYHILLAHDLKMISDAQYEDLARRITEVKRMLSGFLRRLTADG